MSRPVKMKKIHLISTDEYKDRVIRGLHRQGVLEIRDISERLDDEVWSSILIRHPVDPTLNEISSRVGLINKILDNFESVNPKEEDGFFKKLFNPSPPKLVRMPDLHGDALLTETDTILQQVKDEIDDPLEKISEINKRIDDINKFVQEINRITFFDIDFGLLSDRIYTSSLIGTVPEDSMDKLISDIEKVTDKVFIHKEKVPDRNEFVLVVVCLKENFDEILNILRRGRFERIHTEFNGKTMEGRPSDILNRLEGEKEELNNKKQEYQKIIIDASNRYRDDLEAYLELLYLERDRRDVKSNFAKTEKTFLVEGWIPASNVDQFEKKLTNITDGRVYIAISDPDPSEIDDVPVKLNNKWIFKNYELISNLYSVPKYNSYDPTPILAIGFMLFFSIMLTDAMYGVINLILGILLLRGGGKYNTVYRDFGVIFISSGIVSVIIGAITGGWFGDLFVEYFGWTWLNSILLFGSIGWDGLLPAITGQPGTIIFLVSAILIGVLHIDVGVIINIIEKFRIGNVKDALLGDFWFILAQVAIVLLLIDMSAYMYAVIALCIVCLVLLFWGHKAMFIFQITGMLGDTLSYVRLMALGLCTYGMALAFNALAYLAGGSSGVGIIITVLILIVGHLLNWAIQTLGGFVHTMRLHFVEFFGKFYDRGGIEFIPFKENRMKTLLKEE
ncbi:MAG TPA: V-type ATP synthase subunit I [Halobacteria archaeon]|jgi:V/A-type H+-transporting ATPase subunit I|nr:V-type ATP synthase subunit I [Halobacteria archaeon]